MKRQKSKTKPRGKKKTTPKRSTKKKIATKRKRAKSTEVVIRKEDDLIPVASTALATTNGEVVPHEDYFMNIAEARIGFITKVIHLAIKATNPKDWVNQSGTPYLCGSGAEKIARVFGVTVGDATYKRQDNKDDKGDYYLYIFKGRVSLPSKLSASGEAIADSIVAIGTCSSRDNFFSKSYGKILPQSEIEEGNILKSAYTNMEVNGITRLLGLRNLTWDELKEHGIAKESVVSVEYKKGTKKTSPAGTSTTATPNTNPMTAKQKGLIEKRILVSHLLQENERQNLEQKLSGGLTISEASEFIDKWLKELDIRKENESKKPTVKDKAKPATAETQPKKPADDTVLATKEQIDALAQIVADICVQPFEKYLLNMRIADEKLTQAKAKSVIHVWNDELEKRNTLKQKDRKKYYIYVNGKTQEAIEAYSDDYVEYTENR
jgi:hypothetical protein